jgi:hypothetical protein
MRVLVLVLAALGGCYAESPVMGEAIVYGEAPPPLPPPARADSQSAAPSAEHVWVRGCWAWTTSGYTWTAGAWVLRPSANAAWVAPHWDMRGRHHIFVGGYWRQ